MLSKNGLPLDVKFCKKCVISNQRPCSTVEFKNNKLKKKDTIFFDSDGICDSCKYTDTKYSSIDWKKREQQLINLLDKYRNKNDNYDVVVPGSGGKDSAFASHILKYKYGMNPLTVTWAPHLYTDIGSKNFNNWVRIGGLDNILFTPNGRFHSYLTSIAFKNLCHPFQPFIIGQKIIGPLIAKKFGINLVMYGEHQAEHGNDTKETLIPNMQSEYFSNLDNNNLKYGGLSINEIINQTSFKLNDFKPYIPLTPKELTSSNIQFNYLGYYLKWDQQENYYYAVNNTGFEANPERTEGSYSKHSSIDDKIDPFHYYTTLIKFGIGRATYNAAQEIREKKITREEGIELVKKYDTEFPNKYFKEFLEYIDISEDEFWKVIDENRAEHLWSKKNNDWELSNPVWKYKSI